jgi:hypothetical protein
LEPPPRRARRNVNGGINTASAYQIGEQRVLSIGSLEDDNVFVGVGLCLFCLPGQATEDAFFGYEAGYHNTAGQGDTFIGYQAGYSNTTGGTGGGSHNGNTFVGYQAGYSNTTGDTNAFFGTWAGYSNNANNNTFLGNQAGETNSSGCCNTFSGSFAGQFNTTGGGNTFMGYFAGNNIMTGSNDVYIGDNVMGVSSAESNTTRIGDGQTAAYIAGIYGSTSPAGLPVFINSSGQLGTLTSSRRFKEQIRDMGESTDGLMQLRPVSFRYKPEYANGENTLQYGLIAEEVAKVYPDLVAYDNDGKPYSVRYQYITTMLLNEVQKQYHRAEAQAELIKAQQQEIRGLKQQLQVQNVALEQRLSRLERLARVEVAAAR